MTNSHDFKETYEAFKLASGGCECEACKAIRFTLQLAEKVCGEPSEAMLDALCGWKEKRNSYYALREQILKEIEQGDGQ